MKTAIVNFSELGNCWEPCRFLGTRCQRVLACDYPEKVTCKAVQAEIDYLNEHLKTKIAELQTQYDNSMNFLYTSASKQINKLK